MNRGALGIPVAHGTLGTLPLPLSGDTYISQRYKSANYDNYDNYATKPPFGQVCQVCQTSNGAPSLPQRWEAIHAG
jgi:hypothetical protein